MLNINTLFGKYINLEINPKNKGNFFRNNTTALTVTSDITAQANCDLYINTSGIGVPSDGITITLPSNPTKNDIIYFTDIGKNCDNKQVLINPNNKKIMGHSDTLQININGFIFALLYVGNNIGWELKQTNPNPQLVQSCDCLEFQQLKIGDIVGGNYTHIESDGSIIHYGDASGWDDMKYPATRVRRGQNELPAFDYTNFGLLFPKDKTDEYIVIIDQMSHTYKLGSSLYPHIHFIQDLNVNYVFKLAYRWYNNNVNSIGNFVTISTSDLPSPYQFTYTNGNLAQIIKFPPIGGSHITGHSSMLEIKLWREDNVGSSTVLFKQFDLHFEKSQPTGSKTEYL